MIKSQDSVFEGNVSLFHVYMQCSAYFYLERSKNMGEIDSTKYICLTNAIHCVYTTD